ncbi:hypothetical protein AKJ51_04220 [candidate division MSBL1 archaeon SCGC-AAA382A20]|uniref:Uncharacterized protein n=1 Tax=candidate division MSBL1 archaeon SCGC-AAA382A20 TaxID=1698280 RepID=A0A133VI54_9EURY|nr:hypothetical protein AKJ51_04220 [candidate division MSBL1 archaeon SCGC-AAA382A20]
MDGKSKKVELSQKCPRCDSQALVGYYRNFDVEEYIAQVECLECKDIIDFEELKEVHEQIEVIQILWDWIERPVTQEFWDTAGRLNNEEAIERYKEIPDELKELVSVIDTVVAKRYELGVSGETDDSCRSFRNQLFVICEHIKENGYDVPLPYYWYQDGIMIEPEWIVKLTNGIVGWVCDSSRNGCGITGKCRFFEEGEKNDK